MALLNGDDDGFVGINDTLRYTDTAGVINAGGTTANTGSSVYLLYAPADYSGAAVVSGKNGELSIGDPYMAKKEDLVNGGSFDVKRTPMGTWTGFQFGTAYSVIRIANLTEQDGKGLTDDLIAKGIERCPSGMEPTMIVGSRRSQFQLRASRQPRGNNVMVAPVPVPTDAFGIEFVTTDSISNVEPIVIDEA